MTIPFIYRFWILSSIFLLGTFAGQTAAESPVSDWVDRFCGQIVRTLPAKSRRGPVILHRFENASKEGPDFFSEISQAVKATLQKNGLEVYEAASEEATRNLVQKIREEDLALVQCVLSETLTRLNLSARISYPHRGGAGAFALAALEKRQRARALAGSTGAARALSLQEVYRSAPIPLKILDVAVADLTPERPPLVFLLTETALLGYRFENNNLTPDFQVAVPAESEGVASRDPRGTLALYHHQNRDHILLATHRTGGTYLLREENGAWSLLKISADWLFTSGRPPAKSMVLAARPTAGKNHFSGDVSVLNFPEFTATVENRVRSRRDDAAAALTLEGSSSPRGKINAFYQLGFVDQERRERPMILAGGLDGRLRLYDGDLHEITVFREPTVGATLATYFDAERNATYLFTTAPSLPDTSDALSLFEVKDRILKPLAKTNNYSGSIVALGLGSLGGRDGLHVVMAVESNTDPGLESVIYIFTLRG